MSYQCVGIEGFFFFFFNAYKGLHSSEKLTTKVESNPVFSDHHISMELTVLSWP